MLCVDLQHPESAEQHSILYDGSGSDEKYKASPIPLLMMQGAWRPALNISTVLASIGLLLADPNPDDGLMTEVVSAATCCKGNITETLCHAQDTSMTHNTGLSGI